MFEPGNLCMGCMNTSDQTAHCPTCGYKESDDNDPTINLPVRTMLVDKYLIGRVMGQGGFGITYIAYDTILRLRLAIKEFFPQGLVTRLSDRLNITSYKGDATDQFSFGMGRFLNEARTLAQFSEHPNIVTVRDFFQANGTAYMVMNYLEGLTLEEYLNRSGGRLSFKKTLDIMMPVMDALREVHRTEIMHRDISPDNIFIDKNGRVILIDFGAAREEMRAKSKSLSVILKAGYAPEEQYRSKGRQGPWTDVYAVAATMYRAITGKVPPESMDRLDEELLLLPSQAGADIDANSEAVLIKALAIRGRDRYQNIEEFQQALLGAVETFPQPGEDRKGETASGAPLWQEAQNAKSEPAGYKQANSVSGAGASAKDSGYDEQYAGGVNKDNAELLHQTGYPEEKQYEEATDIKSAAYQGSGEKFVTPSGERQSSAPTAGKGKNGLIAAIILGLLLLLGSFSLFNWLQEPGRSDMAVVNDKGSSSDPAKMLTVDIDAVYIIDYENGSIPLGELEIGARVADPSWEWEHRTGPDEWDGVPYSGSGVTKPVTWIVVAKNHYSGGEAGSVEGGANHVTLLTEEIIAKHSFDNSTNRGSLGGSNHWGDSGKPDASYGIRKFLNGSSYSGIDSNKYSLTFYDAMSAEFKNTILTTSLPNKEWDKGKFYETKDKIFLPSTTELGDRKYEYTYKIGSDWGYFKDGKDRISAIDGSNWWYFTRSPDVAYASTVRGVHSDGSLYSSGAGAADYGIRPALNLSSDILVSEIK